MVDVRDGLSGDWCELNFTQGIPKAAVADLQQNYDSIDASHELRSEVPSSHNR